MSEFNQLIEKIETHSHDGNTTKKINSLDSFCGWSTSASDNTKFFLPVERTETLPSFGEVNVYKLCAFTGGALRVYYDAQRSTGSNNAYTKIYIYDNSFSLVDSNEELITGSYVTYTYDTIAYPGYFIYISVRTTVNNEAVSIKNLKICFDKTLNSGFVEI